MKGAPLKSLIFTGFLLVFSTVGFTQSVPIQTYSAPKNASQTVKTDIVPVSQKDARLFAQPTLSADYFVAVDACAIRLQRIYSNEDYDITYSCAVSLPSNAKVVGMTAYGQGYRSLERSEIALYGYSLNGETVTKNMLCQTALQGEQMSASIACPEREGVVTYYLDVSSRARYGRPAGTRARVEEEQRRSSENFPEIRNTFGNSYVSIIKIEYEAR